MNHPVSQQVHLMCWEWSTSE